MEPQREHGIPLSRCSSHAVAHFAASSETSSSFGRKPRVKSLDQVGRELDELRRLNLHNAFFVSDNLIDNLPVAKKLLAFLIDGYVAAGDVT
jgi:hypothetical protein